MSQRRVHPFRSRPRWRSTVGAVVLALVVNALLVAALAALNRRSGRAEAPPRLAWVSLKAPPRTPELHTRPALRRPRPRKEPPKVRPRRLRPMLRRQAIAPRPVAPRLRFVPSLDIHPQLRQMTLELAVSLPDLSGPGLLNGTGVDALDWTFEAPDVSEAPAPPPPKKGPEAGARPQRQPAAPVAVREVDRNPEPIYTPLPQYPLTALSSGVEGRARVRLRIEADGKVSAVEVLDSGGHPSFGAAAARAVRRWRFRPAMRGGKPVALWATKRITFALEK